MRDKHINKQTDKLTNKYTNKWTKKKTKNTNKKCHLNHFLPSHVKQSPPRQNNEFPSFHSYSLNLEDTLEREMSRNCVIRNFEVLVGRECIVYSINYRTNSWVYYMHNKCPIALKNTLTCKLISILENINPSLDYNNRVF